MFLNIEKISEKYMKIFVYIKHYCMFKRGQILIKAHNLIDNVENAF